MNQKQSIEKKDFSLAKINDEALNRVYKANEGLVGYCLNKCLTLTAPQEEIKNTLVDGLIKSILNFDESKGFKFSTFAIKCMMNNAIMLQRKYDSSKDVLFKHDTINLDDCAFESDDSTLTYIDMVSDGSFESYREEEMEEKLDINRLVLFLPPSHRKIMQERLSGSTQQKIANHLGVSRSRVSRLLCEDFKFLQDIVKKSIKVHSLIFKGLSATKVSKMLSIDNISQIKFYDEVYQFLYCNINNIKRICKLYKDFTDSRCPQLEL